MISNPTKLYDDGFTYEGGSVLYHFCPYDQGLSKFLDCNVVFFADNDEHAKDVLVRMFEYVESSIMKRIDETKDDVSAYIREIPEDLKRYLEAVRSGRAKPQLAPTNQFYKVGWAANDTLF